MSKEYREVPGQSFWRCRHCGAERPLDPISSPNWDELPYCPDCGRQYTLGESYVRSVTQKLSEPDEFGKRYWKNVDDALWPDGDGPKIRERK